MTVDQLLACFDLGPNGELRFLVNGHQRMALGSTGLSLSDNDPDPAWFGSGNLYVNQRVGIQTAVGWNQAPNARDLTQTGSGGFPAALSIETTNLPDQVAVQVWTERAADDGLDNIALFVSTSDSYSRPNSRNVGVRIDASNQGQVKALDTREVGQTMPDHLDYPGDAWCLSAYGRFVSLPSNAPSIFFARMMYDIGNNSDKRASGDFEFYLQKHLAEAKA